MIFAYIDPGSGSMIFQVLLAALLAVPFFLRDQIGRAIDRVRGRKPTTASEAADEERAAEHEREPSEPNG